MKRYLFFILFLINGLPLYAQGANRLVEYRSGEFVGLSDQSGQIIVRPRFTSIRRFHSGVQRSKYRRAYIGKDSIGVLRVADDTLILPLKRNVLPSITKYGFIVWDFKNEAERTRLYSFEGDVIHTSKENLTIYSFDKERDLYFVKTEANAYGGTLGDITHITDRGYQVLHKAVDIKMTWTTDSRYIIATDPSGKNEIYLDETFVWQTRPFDPDNYGKAPAPKIRPFESPSNIVPSPPPPPVAFLPQTAEGSPKSSSVFKIDTLKNKRFSVSLDDTPYLKTHYDSVSFPALQFPDMEYYFLVKKGDLVNLVSNKNTWSKQWLKRIVLPPRRLRFSQENKLYLHDRDIVVVQNEQGYRVKSLFGRFEPEIYGEEFSLLSSSTVVLTTRKGYVTINAASEETLFTKHRPVREEWSGKWKVLLTNENTTIGWIAMDGTKYYQTKED